MLSFETRFTIFLFLLISILYNLLYNILSIESILLLSITLFFAIPFWIVSRIAQKNNYNSRNESDIWETSYVPSKN